MSETLSHYLRLSTHKAHERVERALPLLEKSLTLPAYAALLQRMYPLVAAVEATFTPFYTARPDWHSQLGPWDHRASHLVADLGALGYPATACAKVTDTVKRAHLTQNKMRAIGCNYVMQGARLGGRIIHRHLRQTLPPAASESLSYFGQAGVSMGNVWRQWLSHLDQDPSLWADREAIVAGAHATFEVWYVCLQVSPNVSI
jgi:heme oxygenase